KSEIRLNLKQLKTRESLFKNFGRIRLMNDDHEKQEVYIDQGDDYSLEEVPSHARRGTFSLWNVTLGVATAMFFMQVAGEIAVNYGSMNAIITSVYATLLTGLLAMGIGYISAKTGLNANLMTRGLGYGVSGAAFTSIILAVNFIIY